MVPVSNCAPLLDYVRALEDKRNPDRRDALIRILNSKGYPYVAEDYRIWGQKGTNLILSFGTGEKEILATAHYDAAKGSPGANDNASGVAVLLGLLSRLKDYSPKNKVKVIFFDGEEPKFRLGPLRIGTLGSWAYVKRHGVENIIGMYNLELCGLGDGIAIWPVSDDNNFVLTVLKETLRERGIAYGTAKVPIILFSSDHLHFRRGGLEGAFTLSALPRQEEETIRRFVEQRCSVIRLMLSRRLRRPMGVPLIFQRMHSPQDRAEYLNESTLEMMSEVVWQAVVKLDQKSSA